MMVAASIQSAEADKTEVMADETKDAPITLEVVQELINTTVSGLGARQQKEFTKMLHPISEQLTSFGSKLEGINKPIEGIAGTPGATPVDPKLAVMEKQLKDLQTAREADQAKAARLEKESALNKVLGGFQFANEIARETAFKTFSGDLQLTSDGQYVIGDEPLDTAVKGRMAQLSGLLAPKQVGGSGASSGQAAPIGTNDIKPGQSMDYYRDIFARLNS